MIKDECYVLSKHGHLGSIQEVQRLPVWERRYYLHKLNEEAMAQKEANDKVQRMGSGKKPSRRR
jgi:hypothetical protein